MSEATIEFKYNKKKPDVLEKVFIRDGFVYYCKVQRPAPIYDQRKWSKPTEFEYTIDIVVNEDVADAWDEFFTKQPSKKLLKAKFKENYGIEDDADLPFEAKKYFIIKVKQTAQKKDGNKIHPKLRPRVFETQEKDGKKVPVDITFEKLVGNGSVADIMCNTAENDYGHFSYLYRVLMKDLIEYEAESMDEDEEEFLGGSVEYAEDPTEAESEDNSAESASDESKDDYEDEEDDEIDADVDTSKYD